jgi:hypothetical protein
MVKLNFVYISEKNLIIGKKYCFVSEYYFYNKEINFCRYTKMYNNNYTWFELLCSKEKNQQAMELRAVETLCKINCIKMNICIKMVNCIKLYLN